MGFFDQLVDFGKVIAAPVIGFATGGPAGAVLSTANTNVARPKTQVLERSGSMLYNYDAPPMNNPVGLSNSGNPSFLSGLGSTIRNVGSEIGSFARDVAPVFSLFGNDQASRFISQGPAITISNQRPEETSTSGEILGANLGLGNALIQGGRRFLGSPLGQGLVGGAVGSTLLSPSGGGAGAPRITRKMKSDVRRIYMMTGMNPSATADILNSMGTYPNFNFSPDLIFFILLKRFRNDGPVVTKAAVRKTRQTLRRMKHVVDIYNSACKPTTRRAPARRAMPKAVQLIKN